MIKIRFITGVNFLSLSFRLVQYRIKRRIIIHLHLTIYLHDAFAAFVVLQQLTDRSGHIAHLLLEYRQFRSAFVMLLGAYVRTLHLFLHMP